ncbi:MAG: tetratricopeptide repeat protein [Alphaproteobacteria bacterium]|nr:tetratricopeptide repeat protein [Alphaproteobacteria bacterium]
MRAEAIAAYRDGSDRVAEAGLQHILSSAANDLAVLEAALKIAIERHRIADAVSLARRAVTVAPERGDIHNTLGAALLAAKEADEAVTALTRAVELTPNSGDAWFNLGCAQQALGDKAAALKSYRKAQELEPEKITIINNLGVILRELGEIEESALCFENARKIAPQDVRILRNLAHSYRLCGRMDDALRHLDQAVAIDPDNAGARFSRATTLLMSGDYGRGWDEYEWCWQAEGGKPRSLPQPRWDGLPDRAQTLLLYHDQGYGDTIQFSRFIAQARERMGRVIVECPERLAKLMRTVDGVDEVVTSTKNLSFDTHSPIISLGRLIDARLETVGTGVPYMRADTAQIQEWASRLREPGMRVGLVWAGNPRQPRDRVRSTELAALAPLGTVKSVSLYILQKEPGPGRKDLQNPPPGLNLIDLGKDVGDFATTAALIHRLDLLITVDTVTAHLAGAIGCPVWTLLSREADWRWLVDRADSPWYPTMRLFRQEQFGDWSAVMEEVRSALEELARGYRSL